MEIINGYLEGVFGWMKMNKMKNNPIKIEELLVGAKIDFCSSFVIHLWPFLGKKRSCHMVHALVKSSLDYCNVHLIHALEKYLEAVIGTECCSQNADYSTSYLQWPPNLLPDQLLLLTFKTIYRSGREYFKCCQLPYEPTLPYGHLQGPF